MNDEHLLPYQRLDCYRVAKELGQRVVAAHISDRELREQATDAAKSKRRKRAFLEVAKGSRVSRFRPRQ